MTTPKKPHERRAEIMDAAERLFVQQGYEATSVQQILDAIGIAKGTFYHHFSAKEEVMDGIIDRHVAQMRARAEAALAQPHPSAHHRLVAAILAMQVPPNGDQDAMRAELNQPANIGFHERTTQRTIAMAAPLLASIVREGEADGSFSTPYPEDAIALLLLHTAHVLDDLDVTDPATAHRVRAFVHHAEVLLGTPRGALSFIEGLFGGGSA